MICNVSEWWCEVCRPRGSMIMCVCLDHGPKNGVLRWPGVLLLTRPGRVAAAPSRSLPFFQSPRHPEYISGAIRTQPLVIDDARKRPNLTPGKTGVSTNIAAGADLRSVNVLLCYVIHRPHRRSSFLFLRGRPFLSLATPCVIFLGLCDPSISHTVSFSLLSLSFFFLSFGF